jgi:hypothetical protein
MINEIRAAGLRDLPLMRRLTENGAILDSELAFTRDVNDGFTLLTALLPQRGVYTLLARADAAYVLGQFRTEGINACLTVLAPRLDPDVEDTLWLGMLDALVQEAGKRSAHALVAEVDELSPLFETMRIAGFAVYARQEIWRMQADLPRSENGIELEEVSADTPGIHALRCAVTPRLMRPLMSTSGEGLIYRLNGEIAAYIDVARGKQGVMLNPYIEPGVDAKALLNAVVARVLGKGDLPIYVRVRRYHLWLEDTLAALDFEPAAQQAVMVRHIAAGVRHPGFATPRSAFDGSPVPAGGDMWLKEPA